MQFAVTNTLTLLLYLCYNLGYNRLIDLLCNRIFAQALVAISSPREKCNLVVRECASLLHVTRDLIPVIGPSVQIITKATDSANKRFRLQQSARYVSIKYLVKYARPKHVACFYSQNKSTP